MGLRMKQGQQRFRQGYSERHTGGWKILKNSGSSFTRKLKVWGVLSLRFCHQYCCAVYNIVLFISSIAIYQESMTNPEKIIIECYLTVNHVAGVSVQKVFM